MTEEIKQILEALKSHNEIKEYSLILSLEQQKILLNYIVNLQQENKKLQKQNNDLRKIYKNTYKRLFKNGNDELARYFQAQIDDCPTFYVEPIIDYAKEYKIYKSRCEKAIEYIEKQKKKMYKSRNKIALFILMKLEKILQGSDK